MYQYLSRTLAIIVLRKSDYNGVDVDLVTAELPAVSETSIQL